MTEPNQETAVAVPEKKWSGVPQPFRSIILGGIYVWLHRHQFAPILTGGNGVFRSVTFSNDRG